MSLNDYLEAWQRVLVTCREHLAPDGCLAFIVGPAEDRENDRVVDLAFLMYREAVDVGFSHHRRIMVACNTQQASGQQVEWARENRRVLKLYGDLVILATGLQ